MAKNLEIVDEFVEYYLFNEKGVSGTTSGGELKSHLIQLHFYLKSSRPTKKYCYVLFT